MSEDDAARQISRILGVLRCVCIACARWSGRRQKRRARVVSLHARVRAVTSRIDDSPRRETHRIIIHAFARIFHSSRVSSVSSSRTAPACALANATSGKRNHASVGHSVDHDAITVIARRRVLSHRITANLTPSRARHRAMAPALGPAVARAVDDLAHDIRRGRYDAEAPATLAKRVAETLIQAVATASADATVDDVVASVRAVGGRLAVIKREHLLVGNVARRLLRVIRDEFQHDDDETPSAAGDGDDATTRTRRMKKTSSTPRTK